MTAKMACPHCGAKVTPEQLLSEGAWQECLRLMSRFGAAGPLASEYVELFRLPNRGLPVERRARLLAELAEMWDKGSYKWEGVTHDARRPEVVDALRAVLASPTLQRPLKNHNYFKKVLHPLALQARGREERDREAQRRSGRNREREAAEQPGLDPDLYPDEIRAKHNKLLQDGRVAEATKLLADHLYPEEIRYEHDKLIREGKVSEAIRFLADYRARLQGWGENG